MAASDERAGRPDPAATFLRWATMRSACFRGYWLVTSLYLVVVADLSAFELVFLGTAMELTVLASEVPTGVMADTISRKWSIVVSHLVMGSGMLVTGLVTSFPALVATQMVWGLGWTFASGADIAWITDELRDEGRAARTIAASVRRDLYGAAAGMVLFGVTAWIVDLATAIALSGGAMLLLAPFVATRFHEHGFTPVRDDRLRESLAVFRRGFALARRDREILLVFGATALVAFGAEAFDRLYPKRLIGLGFPDRPDPIVWFTALGIATLVVGSVAIRIVEARIAGEGVARQAYLVCSAVGAVGLLLLAHAPSEVAGIAGVLVVSGVAWTVLRTVGAIWVNRRASSDVRATVQSFLGQVESFGEILGGLVLGAVAQATTITVALTCSAVLLAAATLLVTRSRAGRRAEVAVAVEP